MGREGRQERGEGPVGTLSARKIMGGGEYGDDAEAWGMTGIGEGRKEAELAGIYWRRWPLGEGGREERLSVGTIIMTGVMGGGGAEGGGARRRRRRVRHDIRAS